MVRTLITGASGRLGSQLIKRLDEVILNNDDIYLLQNRNQVNLPLGKNFNITTDISSTYDIAIHFAGNLHTSGGNPKKNPENYGEFARDNIELTRRVCNKAGYVIFASTDNVFSGFDNGDYFEHDKLNPPNNFYGQTKADAESIVLDNCGSVIRFQSSIGVPSNLIIDKIYAHIDGKPSWPFWNDQFVRPAFFEDILLVLNKTYSAQKRGIYHVSCSGDVPSRAEIAKKVLNVFREYNIPRERDYIEEEPCNDPDFPRRLALDTTFTRNELGLGEFTSVDEAIRLHVLRTRKL